MAHVVKVEGGSEVGHGFEFFDIEVGAEIVAKSISETNDVSERKLFFKHFVFDSDEDFLLRGATGEITTSGAMASTGKSDGFNTTNIIGLTGFKDNAGIIVVFDIFVEGYSDAA